MLTTIILLAATTAPIEWELRLNASSNTGQAATSGRFPTRQRCEAVAKVMVAFLEGDESTQGLGVRAKAMCFAVSK